jgi:L-lactate dehydrogenase complex protein LldG
MPNDSRGAILAGIRSSIQQSRHTGHLQPEQLNRAYQRSGNLSKEESLHLFAERLREYDARVTITSPALVAEAIAQVMAGSTTSDPLPSSSPWVAAQGFPAHWLPSPNSILWEAQATIDDLNRCAGVITTCSVAIAVTGTLVLQHGPGEGKRQTSLLPDRHLCVLQVSQLVETVPEAFDRLAGAATRPLTFISGPSATADIEMTRIRGVHGPRQLDVFLLTP